MVPQMKSLENDRLRNNHIAVYPDAVLNSKGDALMAVEVDPARNQGFKSRSGDTRVNRV